MAVGLVEEQDGDAVVGDGLTTLFDTAFPLLTLLAPLSSFVNKVRQMIIPATPIINSTERITGNRFLRDCFVLPASGNPIGVGALLIWETEEGGVLSVSIDFMAR